MKRILIMTLLVIHILPVFAQDVSLDKELGAKKALAVEQEMGIYQHDSLNYLIDAVGQKLVSRLRTNPFEFKFFIADSPIPNAFALPGGYIYVTRGILPLLQTEDELAGILAHEIIHVSQRHSVKQMKKGMLTGILKIPGNIINAVTGTQIGNVLNAPLEFTTARYSRGHEKEADQYGIQLAASAGYKTDALADALSKLSRHVEFLTGENEKTNYFSDHPYTPSRVSSIRSASPSYKPVKPSPVVSPSTFVQSFNGLLYGNNPAQGIFQDSLFVHPDLRFAWIVPSQWETINKPGGVVAHNKKGDALVSLLLTDGKKRSNVLGEEAYAKLKKENGVTILAARDTSIQAFSAYLIRARVTDGKSVYQAELLWLDVSDRVFQLTGMSRPSQRTRIHQSLCSFRRPTLPELNSVPLYEVKNVMPNKNETLEELSARANNRLNLQLTALFNDIETDTLLPEGNPVKIVKAGVYKIAR